MSEEQSPPAVEGWGKPRLEPPIEMPSGVRASDVPDALLAPPVDARELVKVGEVCGQQIYARAEIVQKAAQLRENLKLEKNWPSDALLATILALRMGLKPKPTYREIAVMLNMSERHVLRTVRRGSKDAVVERELARLDSEGMPMAVENVLHGLEQQDKDYTLEYMKGRGVFRTKQEPSSGEGSGAGAFTGLVVQFVHDGNNAPEIRAGAIVATPNRALAKTIDVQPAEK